MSNAGTARMLRTSGTILRIAGPKGIECAPVTDTGKFVTVFKRKNHNEFQRWIDRAKKENDRQHFQPRDKIFNKKACS